MERLKARGAAHGTTAADAARTRLAGAVGEEISGVSVSVDGGDVAIAGRALSRRMLDEPALRWIGGLLR
jgi:hypothetical protein